MGIVTAQVNIYCRGGGQAKHAALPRTNIGSPAVKMNGTLGEDWGISVT